MADDDERDEGRTVLYHVICLQNTPPATLDEQECCLESRTSCWRLRSGRKRRPIIIDDDEDDADDGLNTSASVGEPVSA